MTTHMTVSRDGTWKIEVEVSRKDIGPYHSLSVVVRVYTRRGNGRWHRQRVDVVEAQGEIGSSQIPGVMTRIPGSPVQRNGKSRATVGVRRIGTRVIQIGDEPALPSSVGSPQPGSGTFPMDRVTGHGSATWRGETLRVGPVSLF